MPFRDSVGQEGRDEPAVVVAQREIAVRLDAPAGRANLLRSGYVPR